MLKRIETAKICRKSEDVLQTNYVTMQERYANEQRRLSTLLDDRNNELNSIIDIQKSLRDPLFSGNHLYISNSFE